MPKNDHMPASDASNFVASLAKGLQVMRCFGEDDQRLTLSEIAEKTGFTRATARRFLLTLAELGYTSTDGKYFWLTPKVLTLGHAYLSSLSFWDICGVYLEEVSRTTRESANIGVLDGGEVVYVARAAAQHRILSVGLYIGARLPATATSLGQVILASLCEKDLTAFLNRHPLERHTEHTITDIAAYRERIQQVREQGYALADQELELGLRSIAVPVIDRKGETVAAMNLSANAGRVSKETIEGEYLDHLKEAASRIREVI